MQILQEITAINKKQEENNLKIIFDNNAKQKKLFSDTQTHKSMLQLLR